MFANERQILIYEELKERKSLTAAELAQKYNVSMETVRKDMLELEKQDLVIRVHGGAMLKTAASGLPPFIERARTNPEQKIGAVHLAAEIVSENDVIAIDSGATGVFMIEELGRRLKQLTVLTSDMNVAAAADKIHGFEVIMAGGRCCKGVGIFYGEAAENCISGIHPDHTFLMPSSVSYDGICMKLYDHVSTVHSYIKAAKDVVIVFEHAKLNGTALYRVSDLKPEFRYITDSGADEELCREYEEKTGIRIIRSAEKE